MSFYYTTSTKPLHTPAHSSSLPATGQPLDDTARATLEPHFSYDFSRVRVHTDAQAAQSAHEQNALAYTLGSDIVFAEGQYRPDNFVGQKLIAHELAHVVQQDGSASGARPAALPPTDFEQEANNAATDAIHGRSVSISHKTGSPTIQRQPPQGQEEQKKIEPKDSGEVLAEGLKTVAEQAVDNNPKVKEKVIEPLKNEAKGMWGQLSTGEKVGTVGFGALMLGTSVGPMLADPNGRKALAGINLATPFTIIPYMPLRSFSYTLPTGQAPDERLLRFNTKFSGDELLSLYTQARKLPPMSLGVNLQWGYDPSTDKLRVLGADATFSLVPGLSITGGAYSDILRPPNVFQNAEGNRVESKQSIPENPKPQAIPDVRIMVNIDLMKFNPGDFLRQIGIK